MEIGSAVESDTEVVDVDEVVHHWYVVVASSPMEELGRRFSATRGPVATHTQDIADGSPGCLGECAGIVSCVLGSSLRALDKLGLLRQAGPERRLEICIRLTRNRGSSHRTLST